MPLYRKSLFIFRRDLRIDDNTAINEALRLSEAVAACFIFDPAQIDKHPYQSKPALQFMLESLDDLQRQCHKHGSLLSFVCGTPDQIVKEWALAGEIEAVFVNRDYTPFSRRRDDCLKQMCTELGIAWHSYADALLTEPEQAVKSDGSPYKVFTPFYKHARTLNVALPQVPAGGQFCEAPEYPRFNYETLKTHDGSNVLGGRDRALALLDALENLKDYQIRRDHPALESTSRLSAHLKFGTVSIREAYYNVQFVLGSDHPLLRQFYWRDFFTHIAYHYPKVFGHAFISKYDALTWRDDQALFHAWTSGRTGFPIVDAGMRELNQTGYMHNRVRMITASFLVKDLHISWRWGERYFAQHLVDYDPCVNNGNWQWAASTGCDAQPYFRIFNPWLQQQKFDAECRYIYRWIPELRPFSPNIIHRWDKKFAACDYPKPIVDHRLESEKAKAMFGGLEYNIRADAD